MSPRVGVAKGYQAVVLENPEEFSVDQILEMPGSASNISLKALRNKLLALLERSQVRDLIRSKPNWLGINLASDAFAGISAGLAGPIFRPNQIIPLKINSDFAGEIIFVNIDPSGTPHIVMPEGFDSYDTIEVKQGETLFSIAAGEELGRHVLYAFVVKGSSPFSESGEDMGQDDVDDLLKAIISDANQDMSVATMAYRVMQSGQ